MTAILSLIPAMVQAAPTIEAGLAAAKAWLTSLISSGAIPADQQDALHAHVDAVAAAAASGQEPPEFQVQPDPGSSGSSA